jgi:hypothetical protein
MLSHVVLTLSAPLVVVDSSLFVHLLQVALTTPFPIVNEMALLLQ